MSRYTSATDADRAAEGTELEIDARGRPLAARVARKPLYVKETTT